MTAFFGEILGKLLKWVYDIVSNIGTEPENFSYYAMAVIVTTILFKIILLPLTIKQSKSTKMMSKLQPETRKIQEKYKNDPAVQQMKLAELYKEHNYNPASGCLILIVQMPILIAFYRVIQQPVEFAFKNQAFYDSINKSFLWIKDLALPDPYMWGLPLIAGIATFLQSKVMQAGAAGNPEMETTQNTMNLVLPVMIFLMARNFPAGLALYWIVNYTITIIQQLIINKSGEDELKEVN